MHHNKPTCIIVKLRSFPCFFNTFYMIKYADHKKNLSIYYSTGMSSKEGITTIGIGIGMHAYLNLMYYLAIMYVTQLIALL